MKKTIAILLLAMMLLSCVSIPAMAEEKTPLTIWIPENMRIEDYETNAMTKWLEEKGNLDLTFIPQPSADYATKVNMALTLGAVEDLPDVIFGSFSDASIWEWAQAETILPLTEYYNNPELAVNINKAKERTGVDYTQHILSPDGNLYALATFNQSYGNEYPAKAWYYQPWLDALDAEVPTTTEEFYQLLKKVHETDLNGNGKADEIGMIGTPSSTYKRWFEYLMNPFVYASDDQYRVVTDGVVTAAYATDEWREGLKYIKKLMDEGLIASENFTMDKDQYRALVNSADPTVFCIVYYAPDMISKDLGRDTQYKIMAPLSGPNAVQYAAFVPSVASATMVVTANCKNPEAAFRLGDLMTSETMSIAQRFGEEGVNWDYIENVENADNYVASIPGFDLSIVAYNDGAFWGGTEVTNGSFRQRGPYVRHYGIANGLGMPKDKEDAYTANFNEGAVLYQSGGWQPEEVIPKLIYTTEESDLIAEIESNLKSWVQEASSAFIMGNRDIDTEWDAYLGELESIGLSTYLATVQTVYDRMYK